MTKLHTGKRIKALRDQLGISQQRLAEMLGVSRPTVSQIENEERKLSVDELVRVSEILNLPVENLLNPARSPAVVLLERRKRSRVMTRTRINVPQRNEQKFKEVLLYILNKVGAKPNIGETVLYKLFYFIDFNFYERYEEQLIGATYMKNHYGPTPLEFKKIVDRMTRDKEIEKVESRYFSYPQTKYLPLRVADLSTLKANELEIIDSVLAGLSDKNAIQISDHSHLDIPWHATKDGEVIEYESVFYRTPEYSAREYSE